MRPVPPMIEGGCLCGAVRFEIDGAPTRASRCFCSQCRKQSGTAFGAYAHVIAERFRFIAGEALVTAYASSAGVTRTFCSRCGSTLQWKRDGRVGFGIALGAIDGDPGVRPSLDLHPEDAAAWGPPD